METEIVWRVARSQENILDISELNQRIDDIEQKTGEVNKTTERQLQDLIDVMSVVLDAVTYMSGAIERLRVDLFQERGWRQ